MYALCLRCTSSRAPRLRVLGIVIHRALLIRTLDSRAPRLRVLVYDVGHPSGDPPLPAA